MTKLMRYHFDLVRDEKGGLMISMPQEQAARYGLEDQPPRVYLCALPSAEDSIKLVKTAVAAWYALTCGKPPQNTLVEMSNYDDDGYPSAMTLIVR